MNISALQKERAKYQPKLPKSLRGAVKLVEGDNTESVANQEEIKELFPNTYGMPVVSFEQGGETQKKAPINEIGRAHV